MVKNLPANAGGLREVGSIPGSGRSLGMATHSSILAWRIPCTEEPGRLQPMVIQNTKIRTFLKWQTGEILKQFCKA